MVAPRNEPGLLHRVQIQKNISSLRILMFWVTERRMRIGHDNVQRVLRAVKTPLLFAPLAY